MKIIFVILSILLLVTFGAVSALAEEIPSWVKKNAGWWADDQIEDETFVQGIQYLIGEGIIQIPSTSQEIGSGSNEIPSWIKNNAGWWAEGSINDDSFVQSIQHLIEEGIILIPSTTNTGTTESSSKSFTTEYLIENLTSAYNEIRDMAETPWNILLTPEGKCAIVNDFPLTGEFLCLWISAVDAEQDNEEMSKKIPKIIAEKNEDNFRKLLDDFKDNEPSENGSYNRGVLYMSIGSHYKNYQEEYHKSAIMLFESVPKNHPKYVEGSVDYNLGDLYRKTAEDSENPEENYDKAITHFESVPKNHPKYVEGSVDYNLATIYMKLNNICMAISEFEKVLEIDKEKVNENLVGKAEKNLSKLENKDC